MESPVSRETKGHRHAIESRADRPGRVRGDYRRGLRRRLGRALDFTWMALDVVGVTWGVLLTGGTQSPWFLWYASAISAGDLRNIS